MAIDLERVFYDFEVPTPNHLSTLKLWKTHTKSIAILVNREAGSRLLNSQRIENAPSRKSSHQKTLEENGQTSDV
jgi:hypothetical protein